MAKTLQAFPKVFRASLREDPDVILIGEMRDKDTIETAITAAETGHLVFGTLHTGSASDAIDRMVQVFPEGMQNQIRLQLSMTLMAVISQQLVKKKTGGRVLASEVMVVTDGIRNMIRGGNTPQYRQRHCHQCGNRWTDHGPVTGKPGTFQTDRQGCGCGV